MRYIPNNKSTMNTRDWAVWDTATNSWYIWAGSPPVRTADYRTVLDWCKELNK